MITVQQLLAQNVRPVCAIAPDATVFDAIAKMAEQDIGSLLVMEGDKLVGIITERHYARNVMLKGKASPTTPVRDIMERRVIPRLPGPNRRAMHGPHGAKSGSAICRCSKKKR